MALLDDVKIRLNITGTYHDNLLNGYIEDVKDYIESAGVDPADTKAIGLIARGVADMWNFGAGEGKLSPLFMQRCAQMAIEGKPSSGD